MSKKHIDSLKREQIRLRKRTNAVLSMDSTSVKKSRIYHIANPIVSTTTVSSLKTKDYYLILGNGFTIDFLSNLQTVKNGSIDVSNLFKNGELVPWPGNNRPGFLSYKYCPNLWTLGARSNMEKQASIDLIEDVITCANILNKNSRSSDNIYIKAYKELVTYLKALFIYYDNLLDVPNTDITNWGWAKFIKSLYIDPTIGKIHIVTFNYDIWLERVFNKLGLNFSVSNFEVDDKKIVIYKPHGSISFAYKNSRDMDAFEINYNSDSNDGEISEFDLKYDNLTALNTINAIIPPAGDSNRLDFKWAKEIKDRANSIANNLTDKDELIICGISYWHVDRMEIDSLLTSVNPKLDDIKVVNPNPPKVFNAIITTLFDKVIFFNNSQPLTTK
jgi:hypothetical protein